MVFQNYALYPNKTMFQNLAFPLKMRKLSRAETDKKVREAARVLDITHSAGAPTSRAVWGTAAARGTGARSGARSTGVPDGRAAVEPRCKLRVQMRSELKRFHQDLNATVIYVTHDQLEAVTMADKMAVMRGGVLQQYDSPEHVFANPVNTFVAGFVGSPAMSLVSAKVRHGRCVAPRWKGPVGGDASCPRRMRGRRCRRARNSVIMGARHSTILLHATDKPGAISSRVYTVEPTGDITYVHVFLGESIIVVSVPPDVRLQADEPVWIEFDQDKTPPVRWGDAAGIAGCLSLSGSAS